MVKWDASEYSRNSTAQLGWAREVISKLALNGSECVLDIGCGDGKVTAEIAGMVPNGSVVGVDKSEEMINFAAQTFTADDWPNLSFRVMDASALAFSSAFDVVFSNAVLHWVIDHRPVLQGIYQALKPGGRCLLQMAGKGNAAAIIDTIADVVINFERWRDCFKDMPFPYGFYSPEEYLHWLNAVGMTAVRVELLERDMAQKGTEGLAGWIRTTWMPYTHRIPKDERELFIEEIVKAYLSQHPLDEQGMAHVRMMRLEVEAVKIGSI